MNLYSYRVNRAMGRLGSFGSWGVLTLGLLAGVASPVHAATLSNSYFSVQTGTSGEISSLQLASDSFPTNYVLNATNAPSQNTADHQWLGELLLTYRIGSGAWTAASTNKSADGRTIATSGSTVTVTYQNASDPAGIKNFRVVETYALTGEYLSWQIQITNTSSSTIEIGDLGLPLPFNEYWFAANDKIYETRVLAHSFTGYNSSYITVQRPSGVGPYLLMVPDAVTGAGFEYQDHWTSLEHSGSAWAQGGGTPTSWPGGLNVFYIHSGVIKSTNQGYLENTTLTLNAGASKTYGFKFFKVQSEDDVKARLYSEGLVDVTVVPSMIVARDMQAKFALHTSKAIGSVVPQYQSETTLTDLGVAATDQHVYSAKFSHLGQNNITVNYGSSERTVLQFYVMEEIGAALQRHATFVVEKTQVNDSSKFYNKVYDDWMMNTKAKRNAFGGYMGWGDDWGFTHGTFLAEKNIYSPVASEVTSLDQYLETGIWNEVMAGHHTDYRVHDWLNNPIYTDDLVRGYAYPHVYNTYFAMYRIAKLYPTLVAYTLAPKDYLLRAYNILKALYGTGINYNFDTGLMGEQTTPDIIQALRDEGYTTEASQVTSLMSQKYTTFSSATYPYGSEYSFDNTGEEAVYTLAKMNSNATMMGKINTKTRACRGQQPTWYHYSDPTGLNGDGWWQFQYTAALAGYCMDDWVRRHSATPEKEQRLTYAAKLANLNCINSGQISADAANLGAVSWTYQAQKGNLYQASAETHPTGLLGETRLDPKTFSLLNGWRFMAGEADLGLWGAIRILSSDVAIDPIFGVFGYGCDVTDGGASYTVIPRDGVQQRLNLISEKVYVTMNRDQYTSATVTKAKDSVDLQVRKTVTPAHDLKVSVEGMAAGTYDVALDNATVGSVTATAGQAVAATVALGTNATYRVRIGRLVATSGTGGTATGGASGVVGGTGNGGASTGGKANAGGAGGAAATGGSGTAIGGASNVGSTATTSLGGAASTTVGGTVATGGKSTSVGGSNPSLGGGATVASGGLANSLGGGTGNSGSTGTGASISSPGDTGSCSCRQAGQGTRAPQMLLAAIGLTLSTARRRRARRRSET